MERKSPEFVSEAGRSADGHRLWLCRCSCGNTFTASSYRIRTGRTRSCGCLNVALSKERIKHGMRNSREYSSWVAAIQRCHSKTNKDYARWGGRGITVCDEWRSSFEAFYKHIGPRPDGTSLDRIDNSKGYEPGNVRWATHSQQQRNRRNSVRISVAGEIVALVDYASKLGISHGAANLRLKRGKLDGAYRV